MVEEDVSLSDKKLLEIARFALTRLDGAWFMALARETGGEKAWKVDVEAWKQFSYVFGKKIRKDVITNPIWPGAFLDAMGILSNILGIRGREVTVEGDMIYVRVSDCEVQKAIAKAGVADCGIATLETYKGVARGLFGKEMGVDVKHTKNLNKGDEICEVVISR
jgi:hypothetical protein